MYDILVVVPGKVSRISGRTNWPAIYVVALWALVEFSEYHYFRHVDPIPGEIQVWPPKGLTFFIHKLGTVQRKTAYHDSRLVLYECSTIALDLLKLIFSSWKRNSPL